MPFCVTCGRGAAAVLFAGDFLCSRCALLLVGEDAARAYERIERIYLADRLIDAIDRGEAL